MIDENKADETSFENERAQTADVNPVAAAEQDPQVAHAGVRPSTPKDQKLFGQGIEGIRDVPSESFHVPVANVLKGAEEDEFASVAIVGLNHQGRVIVAASHGTPLALDLLTQGVEAIQWVADHPEIDDDMPAKPGSICEQHIQGLGTSSENEDEDDGA